MNLRFDPRLFAFISVLMIFFALACGIPSLAQNAATPTLIPTVARVPTALVPATTLPTRAASVAPPTWWAKEIEMPKGAELTSNSKRVAIWQTQDPNADGILDLVVKSGTSGGYRVYTLTKSQGAIYDVLFVKGTNVYSLNITHGANGTTLTANLGALIHLKATGAVNIEVDLPVKDVMPMTPGSEQFIGTEIPNTQCVGCAYIVFIHIAPFKGPGTYKSTPAGIYLIDTLIVPGADALKEDYRWANDCTVIVQDATRGTFQCTGLSNIYVTTKKIDISGSWIQPPPP